MNIIELIVSVWQAMFTLFKFGQKSITNKLSVFVKINNGKTVAVSLDPKWDIKSVKEAIAPKLGMPPEEVRIILAGKELDDSIVIEECDLGEMSILNAVISPGSPGVKENRPKIKSSPPTTLSTMVEENEDVPRKSNFFVFCSSPCSKMTKGKLRVRCATCKSGAITVDSDPASWSEVLTPRSISGCCEQTDCPAGAVAWAEFYFRCTEHKSQGEQDEAVPLHLIRVNDHGIPCLACMDISDIVLVFSCQHVTCLECFKTYCESRLSERNFTLDPSLGYTLPCPAKCSNSFITEPHHFCLLPDNLYARYQRFGAEEYVLAAGGILCPQPDCGAGILLDDDCIDRVTCINGCGFVFCRKCLQGYHLGDCDKIEDAPAPGSSYTVSESNASQALWNEASKRKIKVTTKPCPKCRCATERAGGCMHMFCTRCSLEWCWVCQTTWTRDCMGNHWFG